MKNKGSNNNKQFVITKKIAKHGKQGMQHITPGVKVKLPGLGPVDFLGDVQYQFGFDEQRDSFWYGAITALIASPKVELKKE